MAELTISQLIKLILGLLVFAAVVIGVYLFFKGTLIDFFKGLPGAEDEYSGCVEKTVDPEPGSYYYEDRDNEGIFYYELREGGWYYKNGEDKSEIEKRTFVKESVSPESYIENVWKTCEKDGKKVILENG